MENQILEQSYQHRTLLALAKARWRSSSDIMELEGVKFVMKGGHVFNNELK